MRWTPGGESSDIEDRRDDSGGGGGGFQFGGMHLGIGGIIILLILSVIFKTNFLGVCRFLPPNGGDRDAPDLKFLPVTNGTQTRYRLSPHATGLRDSLQFPRQF